MVEAGVLYQVIVDFSAENLDMSPTHISTVDMGYIFENLVQRFSESYNEEAGAHFTSRDIIYLMCDLLLTDNDIVKDDDGIHCTVYDMTMGTSQMLTCMEERLKQLDSKATVQTFGQEINPFTMGIAVADTMIHGGDPDNMQFGDTLSDDKFTGYQFDFVISNPPFGIDWKREATAVEAEHKKGEAGRFAPGLPSKSDGQMLFLMNGVKKLKDTGRMAIIQNGSSLFTGDAGSGQSEIRRYLIENDWLDAISGEFKKPYYRELYNFVREEYSKTTVYPPAEDIFNALHFTPLGKVKVLLLGQDPYHNVNQAHGLSFSVLPEQKEIPPSLQNIYKELHDDLGCYIPNNGYLKKWADQGVLLLNTVLTVRAHQANSHQGRGWEEFTDSIIRAVNEQDRPIVYLLWGRPAQMKKSMLNNPKHLILTAPHPSPLSAYRGFFGCKHFSQTNEFLRKNGVEPIDWQIENI